MARNIWNDIITYYAVHFDTENTKTTEQKVQEDELLQDLVKTVEQRSKIEKRKMEAEVQWVSYRLMA